MPIEEITFALFTVGNAVRALAYIPQICKAATDKNGASGISYTSWALFMVAHLSTAGYAAINLADWSLAVCFALNALFCAMIIGVAEWNRRYGRSSNFAKLARRLGQQAGDQTQICRAERP